MVSTTFQNASFIIIPVVARLLRNTWGVKLPIMLVVWAAFQGGLLRHTVVDWMFETRDGSASTKAVPTLWYATKFWGPSCVAPSFQLTHVCVLPSFCKRRGESAAVISVTRLVCLLWPEDRVVRCYGHRRSVFPRSCIHACHSPVSCIHPCPSLYSCSCSCLYQCLCLACSTTQPDEAVSFTVQQAHKGGLAGSKYR